MFKTITPPRQSRAVCAVLMAMWGLCTAPAPAQETIPIRSGCETDYPPFCMVEEGGRAHGFSVELLQAALRTVNREVTFHTGSWAEVKDLLERGEIEVLPLVGRTPEREQLFDFTFPYLSLHGAIVVRQETTDIHELSDLKGRRVAVMEGDNAEEFLRRTNGGSEIRTTPTFKEALGELAEGQHDAVVIQRLLALRLIQDEGISNLRIVGKPLMGLQQEFCFAVKEDDSKTLSLLNEGLALVMANGTFSRLQRTWFAPLERPANNRIVFGTELDYPPYSFLDKNGRATGYNVDLTRAIAQTMGLDVEIKIGPWSEIRQALETGEIDAISGMAHSEERGKRVNFSPPYTVIHHVAFTRRDAPAIHTKDDLRGKDVIVMRGDIMHDYVLENGLCENPILVPTQADALRLLASGKHDCALVGQLPGLYHAKELGLDNIRPSGPPLSASDYCFAMTKGNPTQHLLNEGLAILEETGALKPIYDQWLGVLDPRGISPATVLKHIGFTAAPVLLLLALSILWSRSLKQQVTRRTRELSASQEQLNLALEGAHAGLWSWNIKTGEDVLDERWCGILGYELEEVGQLASSWKRLIHPDDKERIFKVPEKLFKDDVNEYKHEYRMKCKNGEWKWIFSAGKLVERDEEGLPAKMTGIILDITERKRAEERLERLLHDRDKRMQELRCSYSVGESIRSRKTLEQIFEEIVALIPSGWHRPELARCKICFAGREYVSQPFVETEWRQVANMIINGTPCGTIEVFYVEMPRLECHHGAFVKEEQELLDDIARSLSEAVEYDQVEAQLGNHHLQLEELVKKRTSQLNTRAEESELLNSAMVNLLEDHQETNGELERMAAKLQASNKELESFSYSVSHDLRAPLRHVDGFVGLLTQREKDRLDATSARYLETISKSSNRMGQLIDDLLAFSRTGRAALNRQPTDSNDIVRKIWKELLPLPEGRCITWELGELPTAEADPGLLRLVWENLIGNAVKYTGTREAAVIEIGATCEHAEDGSDELVFFVRDNGVGFDPEYTHKLFGVFQRLHRADEFEGTGIGLATVQRIIHRHGGRVWAEGKVNQGATFYFSLQKAT